MMLRRCDRCGGEIPGAVNYGEALFGPAEAPQLNHRDLCSHCLNLLREWMKGPQR